MSYHLLFRYLKLADNTDRYFRFLPIKLELLVPPGNTKEWKAIFYHNSEHYKAPQAEFRRAEV